MEDNRLCLAACVIGNLEPHESFKYFGFIKGDVTVKKPSPWEKRRQISTYIEWDKRIKDKSATYKKIADENGVTASTVCNLLMRWRPHFEEYLRSISTDSNSTVSVR